MNDDDRLGLRNLTFKDGIIALSAFSAYSIAIKFLSHINKQKETDFDILLDKAETDHDEHGTDIKCNLDACEKLEVISKDGDLRDFRNVLALFFPNWKGADKIQVNSISQIKPGDHIVYERVITGETNLYDHHAIVGEVFPEKGIYTAYEQSTPPNKDELKATGKASIREIEKRFDTKSLYKINHGRTGISNDEVKKMAHFICHHATQIDFIKKYN
ncbi:unnamed protein product [Mytilus coruscus]|uniref:Uncharacterized protein n=1 Tax=Mytilus coruscus TaxID=42192 RepID=A0A6J8BM64_MYTCO|nr:unnamed protein product [Mytilus coruscus]